MSKGMKFETLNATVVVDTPDGYRLVKLAGEWVDYGVVDDDVWHRGGDGLFAMVEFKPRCDPHVYVAGMKGVVDMDGDMPLLKDSARDELERAMVAAAWKVLPVDAGFTDEDSKRWFGDHEETVQEEADRLTGCEA